MSGREASPRDIELVAAAVARLRAGIMALVFAFCGGVGLFLATVWLLLQGGRNVGEHLGLLGNYFPGYRVSWLGSLLGLVYGALVGGLVGYSLAWIYNRLASLRQARGATVVAQRSDRAAHRGERGPAA
jgi:hypothetical protein